MQLSLRHPVPRTAVGHSHSEPTSKCAFFHPCPALHVSPAPLMLLVQSFSQVLKACLGKRQDQYNKSLKGMQEQCALPTHCTHVDIESATPAPLMLLVQSSQWP